MSRQYRPRTPKGLGPLGKDLWVKTVEEFELEPHGLAILHEMCTTRDRIADLEAVAAREGIMVDGPQGRKVHSALIEARQARIVFYRLAGALNFPEVEA
jgi:phage terminase small subunit